MRQSPTFPGATSRRAHLSQLLSLGIAAALRPGPAAAAPLRADPRPFSAEKLRRRAADLAGRPYQAPRETLPDALTELTEDAYREIRFRPPEVVSREVV
jgi:glucans biosynthesis protein